LQWTAKSLLAPFVLLARNRIRRICCYNIPIHWRHVGIYCIQKQKKFHDHQSFLRWVSFYLPHTFFKLLKFLSSINTFLELFKKIKHQFLLEKTTVKSYYYYFTEKGVTRFMSGIRIGHWSNSTMSLQIEDSLYGHIMFVPHSTQKVHQILILPEEPPIS
jgi:hypothetical protein